MPQAGSPRTSPFAVSPALAADVSAFHPARRSVHPAILPCFTPTATFHPQPQHPQHCAHPHRYDIASSHPPSDYHPQHRFADGRLSAPQQQLPFPACSPPSSSQPAPPTSSRQSPAFSTSSSIDSRTAVGSPRISTSAERNTGSGNRSVGRPGSASSSSRRCSRFQEGITVGYTYDAFFVSDGRSRRRGIHGQATGVGYVSQTTSAAPPAAPSAHHVTTTTGSSTVMPTVVGSSRQRYRCAECGKHYATSSNLSRHKQTHRSLNSQQARHCPHCGKVRLHW